MRYFGCHSKYMLEVSSQHAKLNVAEICCGTTNLISKSPVILSFSSLIQDYSCLGPA